VPNAKQRHAKEQEKVTGIVIYHLQRQMTIPVTSASTERLFSRFKDLT